MIYCVSDIHGELDKFERLLDLIQFWIVSWLRPT